MKELAEQMSTGCHGYLVYLFQHLAVNDHPGNLIIIGLRHEWRRRGGDSVIMGALFGTDVSSSQYRATRANISRDLLRVVTAEARN